MSCIFTILGKTCGLCGNFNDNQADDFLTPINDIAITPSTFGDSWKVDSSCALTPHHTTHPCTHHKSRAPWSQMKCSIINHDVFKPCHQAVEPKPYYDACYHDVCGCDSGGDCECLCTAVAAYAEACNAHGSHVKWRSQQFCRKLSSFEAKFW